MRFTLTNVRLGYGMWLTPNSECRNPCYPNPYLKVPSGMKSATAKHNKLPLKLNI